MGRPFIPRWEDRDECPTCGNKVMYLPLGQKCLFHGYVSIQRLRAWWRGEPLAMDRALGRKLLRERYGEK